MPVQTMIREGHLTPDQEKTYFHAPFEMPPGVQRLDVAYRYNARISSNPTVTGGNTLDLGVFDERGIDFLTAGFRGWSGSERERFFITPEEATPGYLAGPLNPGTWHVLLGVYKLAPDGCDYTIEITLTTADSPGQTPPAPPIVGELPASLPPDGGWLRGELHCHTWHSDGHLSPPALVDRARQRGLDFLAVTDHNTISVQRELATLRDPGLILIRGIEATTFGGHFTVWGIPDWIDFRANQPEAMRAALQDANQRGGLTSCAHPKPFGPDWAFPEVDNFQCVEVWNGPWNGLDELSLDFWLKLLAKGRRVPAVGGSDYHRPGEQAGGMARDLGTPTSWVFVPGAPGASAILDAVRQGHVSLSSAPDEPFLELRAGAGYAALQGDNLPHAAELAVQVRCLRGAGLHLTLLDQNGRLWEEAIAKASTVISCQVETAASQYVRAELRDADGRMGAMTNPIYLTAGAS